jgi:hypothetical protein
MFEDMYKERQCAFVCAMAIANSIDMFIANELEGAMCQSMNPRVKVWEVFATMQTTLGLFKTLTNFTLAKFNTNRCKSRCNYRLKCRWEGWISVTIN